MTISKQWPGLRRGLVGILRGLKPDEAVGIAAALVEAGFEAIEVPLNSPDPFVSIETIAARFGDKALIGAGTEMLLPDDNSTSSMVDSASDAARRSFAETFSQISEQTVSKNLNVQPTLEIRPGFRFNILVDQDIIFPKAYP